MRRQPKENRRTWVGYKTGRHADKKRPLEKKIQEEELEQEAQERQSEIKNKLNKIGEMLGVKLVSASELKDKSRGKPE